MSYTAINNSTDYFNTKLYEGNGSSPRSITGIGFQPDWTWTKNRDNTNGHGLFDAVRGYTTGKGLSTHNANAEGSADAYGYLSSRDSDGYTMTQGGSGMTMNNTNGESYVSWNWLANGTGVSNTDGSITSTVSANTTSGFSIVSYTGSGSSPSTVGHGLGEVPKMIILKSRSVSVDWQVYHQSLGNATKIILNSTGASSATSNWNSTSPTSSVFTINGTASGAPDASGEDLIAYCFAEKTGFSKFGSYTGNGNADGTFVYTGFKPAFIMVKPSSIGNEAWKLYDNKRNIFNVVENGLNASDSQVEGSGSGNYIDFLSNGFKLRTNDTRQNGSGATNIYMAFAEEPLVGDNPATAR